MKDISIYQTFHKDFIHNPESLWIKPIGVNGYRHDNFLSDAIGENITSLNPYYCELTAFYWVWKNTRSDYVGFYHYRRYLNYCVNDDFRESGLCAIDPAYVQYLSSKNQKKALQKILSLTDVILPTKSFLSPSIEDHYLKHLQNEPWLVFIETLRDTYPQYMSKIDLFAITPFAPVCNIFVMKWPLFDSYCMELFYVVDKVFDRIGSPYDNYQNRYPGFLAERFLSFWMHIHQIQAIDVPMMTLA